MKNNKVRQKQLLRPVFLVNIYLFLVLILFFSGPIKWEIADPVVVFLLLVLYQVLFTVGYYLSYCNRQVSAPKKVKFNTQLNKFIITSLLVSILLNLIYVYQKNGISLYSFWSSLQYSLNNAGNLYQNNIATESSSGLLTSFMTICSPITFCAIPASIFYWKYISYKIRVLSIICIGIEISKWLFIGTNQGIIDVVIVIVSIIFLIQLRSDNKLIVRNIFKNSRTTIFLIILLLIGLFSFFNTMSSRLNSNLAPIYSVIGGNSINMNNWFIKIFPNALMLLPILIDTYLSQGFYGFSLILELKFRPLFGVGNSMFLMQKFKSISGIDVFPSTFIDRIVGWDPYVNWHSAYSWWANDVSVYGVFIVMLVLGYYFFKVIDSAVNDGNFVAVMLFSMLCQMIFYLPINNQILSQPLSFMPFVVYSLIFLTQSINRNRRRNE